MGLTRGQEINHENLNSAFISSVGGGTLTGNYEIIGNLDIGTAIQLRGHNDESVSSDMHFYLNGIISFDDSAFFIIDSNNSGGDAYFSWRKNSQIKNSAVEIMRLAEDGRIHLHCNVSGSMSVDGAITIGETNNINLTIDKSSIIARNNGSAGNLKIDANQITFFNNKIWFYDNGNVSIDGNSLISGNLELWGRLTTNDTAQNNSAVVDHGFIELYHSTPYIDFHYNNTTANYNVRLINNASGILMSTGSIKINGTTKTAGAFYTGTANPTNSNRLNYDGYFYATKVYNAVFNDIAEFMKAAEKSQPGNVMIISEKGLIKSNKRASTLVAGVHSDTFGYALGADGSEDKIPIALSGTVKVFIKGKVKAGDFLISYKDGFACRANIFDRIFKKRAIIGVALESGENTRIWMLVK